MNINKVLLYPGSKWRIADEIVKLIPDHHTYLEPFFGSGAVFFSKVAAPIETINDIDSNVVNLFRCIQTNANRLADMVASTPFSREVYEEQRNPEDDFDKALLFLIKCWQGYGVRTCGSSGWKNDVVGRERAYAVWNWYRLPDWILNIVDRIRMTQIDHRNAVDEINQYNNEKVFMYIDPPYVLKTRKQKQYEYEMSDEDHKNLLIALISSKAKIILSGYECDLYNEYLFDWRKIQINTRAQSGGSRIETLYLNY